MKYAEGFKTQTGRLAAARPLDRRQHTTRFHQRPPSPPSPAAKVRLRSTPPAPRVPCAQKFALPPAPCCRLPTQASACADAARAGRAASPAARDWREGRAPCGAPCAAHTRTPARARGAPVRLLLPRSVYSCARLLHWRCANCARMPAPHAALATVRRSGRRTAGGLLWPPASTLVFGEGRADSGGPLVVSVCRVRAQDSSHSSVS
jgi:hypothetical protein